MAFGQRALAVLAGVGCAYAEPQAVVSTMRAVVNFNQVSPKEVEAEGVQEVTEMTDHAVGIVRSMVEEFLQKDMTKEEEACLEKGSQNFREHVVKAAGHAADLLEAIVPPQLMPEDDRRLQGLDPMAVLGAASSSLEELGGTMHLLTKLARHIADNCVSGKALDELEMAVHHAEDPEFLATHFLAKGGDVVMDLAHASKSYHTENFHGFGRGLGKALRTVLLSKVEDDFLAEGPARTKMMMDLAQGFSKGFFGKGFEVKVNLEEDPDTTVHIDLQSCLTNNLPFFEKSVGALMEEGGADEDPFASLEDMESRALSEEDFELDLPIGEMMEMDAGLAAATMELPDAFKRCGVSKKHAEMLSDSIQALGSGMHLELATDNKEASDKQMNRAVVKTVHDWKKLNWFKVGMDMGHLLQQSVVSVFPQKYTVDDTRALQRKFDVAGPQSAQPFPVAFACAALLAASGLVMGRRAARYFGAQPQALALVVDEETLAE